MEYHWCAYASNLLYRQSYLITIGFAIVMSFNFDG